MFERQAIYAPRPIHFLDLWQCSGWQLKIYGIAYRRPTPRHEVIRHAHHLVTTHLATLSAGKRHYGIGFVGIHDGRGGIFTFVDYWADEDELHHHVFVAPIDRPEQSEYMTSTGLTACVWDLQVIGFERNAWVKTVLANPTGADFAAYLDHRLDIQA